MSFRICIYFIHIKIKSIILIHTSFRKLFSTPLLEFNTLTNGLELDLRLKAYLFFKGMFKYWIWVWWNRCIGNKIDIEINFLLQKNPFTYTVLFIFMSLKTYNRMTIKVFENYFLHHYLSLIYIQVLELDLNLKAFLQVLFKYLIWFC